jgi:hypothetical protein
MRVFLIFLVIAGLGFVFLRQKQSSTPQVAAKPVTTQTAAAKPAPASAALTPAPRGQASEYNYMKRALDRARDVRDQSRAQTAAAQNP